MIRTYLFFFLCAFSLLQSLEQQDVQIDLKNPLWEEGSLYTSEGGIVIQGNMRIQAEKITYHQKDAEGNPISILRANNKLMLEYDRRLFIGESLEYDFQKKQGTIIEGKTAADIWFLEAKKIHFYPHDKAVLEDVTLTTCESRPSGWHLIASSVEIDNDQNLSAKNVRFMVGPVPFFYFPVFYTDLETAKNPPLTASFRIGSKEDNRLGLRYRIWENNEWETFFRLAYHVSRGLGGGLEAYYKNSEETRSFYSQNFYAKDRYVGQNKQRHRYQFAGHYQEDFRKGLTNVSAMYDKASDDAISRDFYTNDYSIQNIAPTYARVINKLPYSIQSLRLLVRVNRFQTVKQEIPSLKLHFRPYSISPLGLILQSHGRMEYLDFTYAKGTPGNREYSAPRLRFSGLLMRPLNAPYATFTPYTGMTWAYYGNSPEAGSLTNYFFRYGLKLNSQLGRRYTHGTHKLYPYIKFDGYTAPKKDLSEVYIFDHEDAITKLSLLTLGVSQDFYLYSRANSGAFLHWDCYVKYFLSQSSSQKRLPRIYNELTWNPTQKWKLFCNTSYYRQKRTFDLARMGAGWTVNKDIAFRAQLEHRRRYAWLKANPNSFFLEATRSEEDLLNSQLSRPENSLLTYTHFRIHPSCALLVQTRNAWKRNKLEPYTEWNVGIETILGCQWKLDINIEHTKLDNRLGFAFRLLDGRGSLSKPPPIW